MNTWYRQMALLLIAALLHSMFPREVSAQPSIVEQKFPGAATVAVSASEDWYQQEISRTRQIFQEGITQTLASSASAAGTLERGEVFSPEIIAPVVHFQSGCHIVAQMDEDSLSVGSENMTVVTDQGAFRGIFHYRGESIGFQRLVGYQRYPFDPNREVLLWQVMARSSTPGLLLNTSFIDGNGNVTLARVDHIKGDSTWEVFGGVADKDAPNISISTSRESQIVELDALTLYACDPSSAYMPFVGLGASAYSCGEEWITERKAGRTASEVEWANYLQSGSVLESGEYYCWKRVQSTALNHATDELLTFVQGNRDLSMDAWIVSSIAQSNAVVPFWADEILATSSRGALRVGSRILSRATPWAIALGIFTGGAYYGWQAYLNVSNPQVFNPPVSTTYTAKGRSITFVDQRFVSNETLFGIGQTAPSYYVYRLENLLTDDKKEFRPDVDARKLGGYLTDNAEGETTAGFAYSEEYLPQYVFANGSYSFMAIYNFNAIAGQLEQEVGNDDIWRDHPDGPITGDEATDILTKLTDALEGTDTADLDTPEQGRCGNPLSKALVFGHIAHSEFNLAMGTKVFMVALIGQGDGEDHYTHILAERYGHSGALYHFPGVTFPDGNHYSIPYVCITNEGLGTWVRLGILQADWNPAVYPYSY